MLEWSNIYLVKRDICLVLDLGYRKGILMRTVIGPMQQKGYFEVWLLEIRPRLRIIAPEIKKHENPPDKTNSIQKPNSWTYNFVEVSGHNLESSKTWGFHIQCLLQTSFKPDYIQEFHLSWVQSLSWTRISINSIFHFLGSEFQVVKIVAASASIIRRSLGNQP